jgi:hypothetical protein
VGIPTGRQPSALNAKIPVPVFAPVLFYQGNLSKEFIMHRQRTSLLIAGALVLSLSACSSTPVAGDSTPATPGSAGASAYSPDSGASGGNPSAIASTSAATASGKVAATPNSRVTLIETVPRQTSAADAAGSSGSGATGSSGADNVYRITVVTDEGATQVITQDWAPTFRNGDRVRLQDGAIQR